MDRCAPRRRRRYNRPAPNPGARPLQSQRAAGPEGRVSTLELFFDLVFVFTITQVTHLVAHAHGAADFTRAFLLLAVTWWMYGGYAWLTNNIGTRDPVIRVLLVVAMAGFLMMALAIPQVAERDGLIFGLAYLFVVAMHLVLFTHAPNRSARAIFRIAPFNLVSAAAVIAAAFFTGPANVALWAVALVAVMAAGLMRAERGFSLHAGHFAERHGLVVIIALGESVIALGTGASEVPLGVPLMAGGVLGIALLAALWWSYFAHDDTQAERVMARASDAERARLGLQAYWFAHLLMIAGILVGAAGLEGVVAGLAHPPRPHTAWFLAAGVALYLLGEVAFRHLMCLGPVRMRLAALVPVAASVAVGLRLGGLAQLAMLVAVLVGMLAAERGVAPPLEPRGS